MLLLLFSRLVLRSPLPPETLLVLLQNAPGLIDKKLPAFNPQQPHAEYPVAFEVETAALSKTRGTQGRGYITATPIGSQLRLFLRPAWSSLGVLGVTWVVAASLLKDALPPFLASTSTTLEAGNVILPALLAAGMYGVLLLGFRVETRRVRRQLTELLCPPVPAT